MKITIESTMRIIQVTTGEGAVPARVWEGTTESGIRVECLVTRIAAHKDQDLTQFEKELKEHRAPVADSAWPSGGIPFRFIL